MDVKTMILNGYLDECLYGATKKFCSEGLKASSMQVAKIHL